MCSIEVKAAFIYLPSLEIECRGPPILRDLSILEFHSHPDLHPSSITGHWRPPWLGPSACGPELGWLVRICRHSAWSEHVLQLPLGAIMCVAQRVAKWGPYLNTLVKSPYQFNSTYSQLYTLRLEADRWLDCLAACVLQDDFPWFLCYRRNESISVFRDNFRGGNQDCYTQVQAQPCSP